MSAKTLTYTGTLVITRCWCGIELAVPRSLYDHAQANADNAIYCPLGHTFVFRTSEVDRLRKQLDQKQTTIDWYDDALKRTQQERDSADRSAAAYKGHVTRLRKRIASGVCPVGDCHRNFANVRGHIERMHPQWAEEHPEALS